jgi:hypothetical protein
MATQVRVAGARGHTADEQPGVLRQHHHEEKGSLRLIDLSGSQQSHRVVVFPIPAGTGNVRADSD